MQIEYVKYHLRRLPRFQVATALCGENGRRFVVTRALAPEAADHIRRVRENHRRLKAQLGGGKIRVPELLAEDQTSLRFEYAAGCPLDGLLWQAFQERDRRRLVELVDEYVAGLRSAFKIVSRPEITDELRQAFGLSGDEAFPPGTECLAPVTADPVLDNLIVGADGWRLVGFEWVFEGALPLAFIVYRSLFRFYRVKYADFGVENFIPLETLLSRYHIGAEQARQFRAMDDVFRGHVFGVDRGGSYFSRYEQSTQSFVLREATIRSQRDEINRMRDEIDGLKKQTATDRQALTVKLAEKEQIIGAIYGMRGWKLLQKTCRAVDRIFPPGTLRRRIAGRILAPFARLGA